LLEKVQEVIINQKDLLQKSDLILVYAPGLNSNQLM